MRIRGLFLFRRYSLPIFIVLLLLFALVLMSLRTKQRKGVELFDALLMEISFPFQKAATLVIKIVNLEMFKLITKKSNYHRRSIANRQSITTIGSTVCKLQLHLKPSLCLVSIDNHQLDGLLEETTCR